MSQDSSDTPSPRGWLTSSRRAFTLGLGSAWLTGCLSSQGVSSSAEEGFAQDGFAQDGYVPFDAPDAFLSPSTLHSMDLQGGAPHLLTSSGFGATIGGDTRQWCGPAESRLTLVVRPEGATVVITGPFDRPQAVSGSEFSSGFLHQRIRTEIGDAVIEDVFQALRELGG